MGDESKGQAGMESRIERIADLFNEAGMLRHTPRTGWFFLGSGREDVAEHSFRVALISFVLAKMAGCDPYRAMAMGLFHDLHEARTGDANYMNQRYETIRHREAQADALAGTGLEDEVMGLYDEFEAKESAVAKVVKDADQLDLVLNLKEELDRGNAFAREWLDSALLRLRTPQAREVAGAVMASDHNRWWYGHVDPRWWIDRERRPGEPDGGEATLQHGFGHWSPYTQEAQGRPKETTATATGDGQGTAGKKA